jgi:hypothetical protein
VATSSLPPRLARSACVTVPRPGLPAPSRRGPSRVSLGCAQTSGRMAGPLRSGSTCRRSRGLRLAILLASCPGTHALALGTWLHAHCCSRCWHRGGDFQGMRVSSGRCTRLKQHLFASWQVQGLSKRRRLPPSIVRVHQPSGGYRSPCWLTASQRGARLLRLSTVAEGQSRHSGYAALPVLVVCAHALEQGARVIRHLSLPFCGGPGCHGSCRTRRPPVVACDTIDRGM